MLKLNFDRLMEDTSGQDLIEYALIFACVGLAAVAGTHGVAANVTQVFTTIANNFTTTI